MRRVLTAMPMLKNHSVSTPGLDLSFLFLENTTSDSIFCAASSIDHTVSNILNDSYHSVISRFQTCQCLNTWIVMLRNQWKRRVRFFGCRIYRVNLWISMTGCEGISGMYRAIQLRKFRRDTECIMIYLASMSIDIDWTNWVHGSRALSQLKKNLDSLKGVVFLC